METTRKELRKVAERLGAIRVANNIFCYENVMSYISYPADEVPADYKAVIEEVKNSIRKEYPDMVRFFWNFNFAYSYGVYGNNGRLDSIGGYDNKGNKYENIGYIYY